MLLVLFMSTRTGIPSIMSWRLPNHYARSRGAVSVAVRLRTSQVGKLVDSHPSICRNALGPLFEVSFAFQLDTVRLHLTPQRTSKPTGSEVGFVVSRHPEKQCKYTPSPMGKMLPTVLITRYIGRE